MDLVEKLHEKLIEHAEVGGTIKRRKVMYILGMNHHTIKRELLQEMINRKMLEIINRDNLRVMRNNGR